MTSQFSLYILTHNDVYWLFELLKLIFLSVFVDFLAIIIFDLFKMLKKKQFIRIIPINDDIQKEKKNSKI